MSLRPTLNLNDHGPYIVTSKVRWRLYFPSKVPFNTLPEPTLCWQYKTHAYKAQEHSNFQSLLREDPQTVEAEVYNNNSRSQRRGEASLKNQQPCSGN